VSRGRKPKKSAKRAATVRAVPPALARPESAITVLQRTFGSRERPAWFDDAITRVLDGADALVAANGPCELEQLTTELVGAQVYTAIYGAGDGLRFDWWFTELADATRGRFDQSAGDGTDWRPWFWLLHGLAAIAPPALVPARPGRGFVKSLRADPVPPSWLTDATRIVATGEVWRMRDLYGTRYAVIAEYTYPRGTDRHVLLLDIDAYGFIVLADVGVFDDIEQAAAAWRTSVGDSAQDAQLERVTEPDQLMCLVHLDLGDEFGVRGDEPRSVVDNWFRADRRIRELHDALRRRRIPLPPGSNLYREVDIALLTVPFVVWYAAAHGAEPGTEAVESLAEQWMEGALPETWFDVSPRRVRYQLDLISDWIPDEVTTQVQTLMPEWVRWLGERAALPAHLLDPVVAGAGPHTSTRPETDTDTDTVV
jgi:hypothetical protein